MVDTYLKWSEKGPNIPEHLILFLSLLENLSIKPSSLTLPNLQFKSNDQISYLEKMGSFISTLSDNESSSIIAIHTIDQWKAHFNATKGTGKLVVIDFTASWCGPCRFIEPAVKELAAKFTDVLFLKVDVDELMEVSQEWGVQAMPTFSLVKGGKQIDKVVGANKYDLEKKIEMHKS